MTDALKLVVELEKTQNQLDQKINDAESALRGAEESVAGLQATQAGLDQVSIETKTAFEETRGQIGAFRQSTQELSRVSAELDTVHDSSHFEASICLLGHLFVHASSALRG